MIGVFFKLLLLFIVCFTHVSFAEDSGSLLYKFIKLKDGYAFRGKFFIKTTEVCLFDIAYKPMHLKKILGKRYAIDVVSSEKDSYDVRYAYKTFLGEMRSVYRKTLKLSEEKIVFEMITNEQKGFFLPKLISSKGSYQITQENDGCWLEYYQECKIESSSIKDISLFFVKNEAMKFMRNLKKYAERICH